MDKTSAGFIEQLKKVQSALDHHMKDEEQEIFPKTRQGIEDGRAQEMGEQYRSLKEKALKKAA